ncbi:MAG TPA: hypothetical protein PK530_03780, partial [Anaerolineales bacterium]|nr:hypothetical protein [Anaerolineales bacterium]
MPHYEHTNMMMKPVTSTKALSTTQEWRLRPRERQPFLALGDMIASGLSLVLALYLWGVSSTEWLGFSREFLTLRVPLWFYLLPAVWLALIVELYDIHRASKLVDTARGIAVAALLGLGLYIVIYFASPPNTLPRT